MRETGNNVPGAVFMPDGETGQTALEIPDRKIERAEVTVIIKRLRYTKQNVKGQVGATCRWPISREKIFLCLS